MESLLSNLRKGRLPQPAKSAGFPRIERGFRNDKTLHATKCEILIGVNNYLAVPSSHIGQCSPVSVGLYQYGLYRYDLDEFVLYHSSCFMI